MAGQENPESTPKPRPFDTRPPGSQAPDSRLQGSRPSETRHLLLRPQDRWAGGDSSSVTTTADAKPKGDLLFTCDIYCMSYLIMMSILCQKNSSTSF